MNHFYRGPAFAVFWKLCSSEALVLTQSLFESDCPSTAPYYLRLHTCRLLALLWSLWTVFFSICTSVLGQVLYWEVTQLQKPWLFIQCSDYSTSADPYCCVLLVICVFWLPPSEIAYWWQWLVFRPCQSILTLDKS